MNVERIREYCLSMPLVEEKFPFDEVTLVFYIGGKMFGLIGLDDPTCIAFKCEPERSIALRERYEGIEPGFHLNKSHWNTISFNADVPDDLILELADLSYRLVIAGLTKKRRAELGL